MTSDLHHHLIRVELPDRPGSLGAVASRIGSVRGGITAIVIVERNESSAIDEIMVELPPNTLELCVREMEAVDGVKVVSHHPVRGPQRDPAMRTLDAAADIASAPSVTALIAIFAERVLEVLAADWALVETPEGDRSVEVGSVPSSLDDSTNPHESISVALTPLDHRLIVGRASVPFRPRDRELLESLHCLVQLRLAALNPDMAPPR